MEVWNSSHAIVIQLPLVFILVLCALQELPLSLITAMGQDAMIWRLEVTSVSAMKDGGELDAIIQDRVCNYSRSLQRSQPM